MDKFTPVERSRIMSAIRSRDTLPEVMVRKMLFANGWRFRVCDKRIAGHPDIVIPKCRTLIEVRGCFWHHHGWAWDGHKLVQVAECKTATAPKSTHENLPAELIHRNKQHAFLLNGQLYPVGNVDGYNRFWSVYDRPPKAEYRNYLLERRDSLIPYDERSFKGAFYTPLKVVDKAYDLLAQTLGGLYCLGHVLRRRQPRDEARQRP